MAFTTQSPDLRRRSLVTRASRFAARSPGTDDASYPISVRRLAVSLSASFSVVLAGHRLAFRLESLRPGSPEDLHLLVMLMLGTLRGLQLSATRFTASSKQKPFHIIHSHPHLCTEKEKKQKKKIISLFY